MKPHLLLVGLGNPGSAYEESRHNAGFLALERLSREFGVGEWKDAQKFSSIVQEARIVATPALLVKPQTYMNLSGDAIVKLLRFYKLDAQKQLIVLCDDVDLPAGTVRLRNSGGPGTHNGLKSIVTILGEKFPRLRIGIGPQPAHQDLAAWVLSAWTREERKTIDGACEALVPMIRSFVMDDASEEGTALC
jgi:PTH1 family peptidyl-tRNA hydrolase